MSHYPKKKTQQKTNPKRKPPQFLVVPRSPILSCIEEQLRCTQVRSNLLLLSHPLTCSLLLQLPEDVTVKNNPTFLQFTFQTSLPTNPQPALPSFFCNFHPFQALTWLFKFSRLRSFRTSVTAAQFSCTAGGM